MSFANSWNLIRFPQLLHSAIQHHHNMHLLFGQTFRCMHAAAMINEAVVQPHFQPQSVEGCTVTHWRVVQRLQFLIVWGMTLRCWHAGCLHQSTMFVVRIAVHKEVDNWQALKGTDVKVRGLCVQRTHTCYV